VLEKRMQPLRPVIFASDGWEAAGDILRPGWRVGESAATASRFRQRACQPILVENVSGSQRHMKQKLRPRSAAEAGQRFWDK
jgi:hypothetical protein